MNISDPFIFSRWMAFWTTMNSEIASSFLVYNLSKYSASCISCRLRSLAFGVIFYLSIEDMWFWDDWKDYDLITFAKYFSTELWIAISSLYTSSGTKTISTPSFYLSFLSKASTDPMLSTLLRYLQSTKIKSDCWLKIIFLL